ncbi:endonuclease/exonuclease/phosphatase [Chitinophaga sp. SYP-B3965]|uniref:endonuclease/exonuclease/phosphatase family protein n=1 Tax=Chitinophaga sp. SYP-B3965 TaxID=2663120 RepID=UPI001299FEA7|nr:endonuclease/exonuclease/phosphatase family protein [Chitinophaga sp. SYP-B3965]MRG45427.1 endonuclease/exonuclease/phosphatase [Chitinophaga sp. SYP-B3965]
MYYFLLAFLLQYPKEDTLRVMTYNIHHCNPPSKEATGEIDIDAIANVIKSQHPDVLALQEVDVNTKRSGNIDQAAVLASKTGMHVYFGKAIDYDGGGYGVAILSKFPLKHTKTIRLPEASDSTVEDRVVAIAEITLRNGKKLTIGSTHFDVKKAANREEQAAALNNITASPLIIAGDLNCTPESAAFKLLSPKFTSSCTDCGFTIPVNAPKRVIDHIIFSPAFSVKTSTVVNETYASDHLPVVAEIIIK